MYFFRALFHPKTDLTGEAQLESVPAAYAPLPNYDPLLIQQLLAEHQQLKTIYFDLGTAGKAGDFVQVEEHLTHFLSILAEHLRKECGVFDFLEYQLAGCAEQREIVRAMRRQMDSIAPVLKGRLASYEGVSKHPLRTLSLARDMAVLGGVLVGRIQQEEETLYPLYQAPEA